MLLEAVESFFRDDEMVEDAEAQDAGGGFELALNRDVRRAGLQIAGRVVVRENHRRSPVGERVGKDFTGMNLALIEQADGDDAFLNDFVGAIECDTDKMLLQFAPNILQQGQHVLRFCDFDGVTDQVPPGQLECGQNLRGLGQTHAGNTFQMIESQLRAVFPDFFGHITGDDRHVPPGHSHAENARDEFLISQRGRAPFFQFLTGPILFVDFCDGFQTADIMQNFRRSAKPEFMPFPGAESSGADACKPPGSGAGRLSGKPVSPPR